MSMQNRDARKIGMRSNSRKREIIHVLYCSNCFAVYRNVTEWGFVQRFVPIPIHSEYGGMPAEPVAAKILVNMSD